MRNRVLLILVFVGFMEFTALAQENTEGKELKSYYVVILSDGANRSQDSLTAALIQKAHIENINRLAASGLLNVAGPFLDESNLRGIFIFDVRSQEEVKAIVDNDPAVKSGRLAYEIHPWMTQKGTCFH